MNWLLFYCGRWPVFIGPTSPWSLGNTRCKTGLHALYSWPVSAMRRCRQLAYGAEHPVELTPTGYLPAVASAWLQWRMLPVAYTTPTWLSGGVTREVGRELTPLLCLTSFQCRALFLEQHLKDHLNYREDMREGQAKIEGVKTYKSGFSERLISFGVF